MDTVYCSKCGAEIHEGQLFCPKCGQKVSSENDSLTSEIPQTAPAQPVTAVSTDKKKNGKMIIIIAVAAVVVIGVVLAVVLGGGGGSKVDFKKLYEKYCISTWAKVGADGSYLSIDTNPADQDDNGLAYPAAYEAIKNINAELQLPESLFEAMGKTTSSQGKQSETFAKLGITVSWTYHPDKGLEVTYKKDQ